MPKAKDKPVVFDDWNDLTIHSVNGSGCYVYMLEHFYRYMKHALSKHSKVLCFRVDLRFPDKYPLDGNRTLSPFLNKLIKKMRRRKEFFTYCWVRERSNEKKWHYHMVMFMNGNKRQNCYAMQLEIAKMWAEHLILGDTVEDVIGKGYVDFCNTFRNGRKGTSQYMLHRKEGDGETFRECFYRLSYMAKQNQKKRNYGKERRIGGSRIKFILEK